MKKDDLIDSLNEIDDDLLIETDKRRNENINKKKRPNYIRYVAIAASLILIASIILPNFFKGKAKNKIGDSNYALATSVYPEDNVFNTNDSNKEKTEDKYNQGLMDFTNKTIPLILKDSNGGNKVYSPTNAYLAMSMIGEITGGESRDEVLDLLEVSDIEELRESTRAIWLSNYSNSRGATSTLNNSIWLRDGYEYNLATLNILKDQYYASSFSGDMTDPGYSEALRTWMNESTGDLLEDSIESIEFDVDTVISLVSTIYFDSDWKVEFEPEDTYNIGFTLDSGEEISVESMGITEDSYIYKGEGYTSTSKDLKAGSMLFILPDEGVKTDEILDKDSFKEYLNNPYMSKNLENEYDVNLRVPKFKISNDIDLIEVFKELGMERVFDSDKSDFSNLSEISDKLYISEIKQGAMTEIEESGVLGAAYTYVAVNEEAALVDEEAYDFILDRPFIFVIYGLKDEPLFIGVINNPNLE